MSCRRHLNSTDHAIEIYRLRFARGCDAPSSLLRFCGAFGSAVGLMLSLPFIVEFEAMSNPSPLKGLRRPLMGAEAGRVCGVGANQSFSARSLFRKSIRGLSAGKLETQARSSWLVDIRLNKCSASSIMTPIWGYCKSFQELQCLVEATHQV